MKLISSILFLLGFISSTAQNAKPHEIVNVERFGFNKSNPNNSLSLQKAIDYCAGDSSCRIIIPGGKFIFRTPVLIDNTPIIGSEDGTTQFVVAEEFEFNKSLSSPRNGAFLYNKGFKRSFDAATANDITLKNINIISDAESKSPLTSTTLLLANVQNGVITNCSFTSKKNASMLKNTLVDLYSCVKNLTMSNCKLNNYNQKSSGGGMWVRNQTSGGGDTKNTTENIILTNIEIKQAGKDEALSIFGSGGLTQHITVNHCTFYGIASSINHSVLLSIIPLDGKYGGQYAAVKNVSVMNSTFIDSNYRNYILRVGGNAEKDRDNICEDITIENNTFFACSKVISNNSSVIRCVKNIGSNIIAKNNKINSCNIVPVAIYGFNTVSGNNIDGNILIGIYGADHVENNTIKFKNRALVNCGKSLNNIVLKK